MRLPFQPVIPAKFLWAATRITKFRNETSKHVVVRPRWKQKSKTRDKTPNPTHLHLRQKQKLIGQKPNSPGTHSSAGPSAQAHNPQSSEDARRDGGSDKVSKWLVHPVIDASHTCSWITAFSNMEEQSLYFWQIFTKTESSSVLPLSRNKSGVSKYTIGLKLNLILTLNNLMDNNSNSVLSCKRILRYHALKTM